MRRIAWRNCTCDATGVERTRFLCDVHLRSNDDALWVRAEDMDAHFPDEGAAAVQAPRPAAIERRNATPTADWVRKCCRNSNSKAIYVSKKMEMVEQETGTIKIYKFFENLTNWFKITSHDF